MIKGLSTNHILIKLIGVEYIKKSFMTVPLINTLVTAGKDIYKLMNLPFFLSSCTKTLVFHLDFKPKQGKCMILIG